MKKLITLTASVAVLLGASMAQAGFYGGIEPQIITKTGDVIHLYVGS